MQNTKEQSLYIGMPTLEEILEDNFSYPKYAQDQIEKYNDYQKDQEELPSADEVLNILYNEDLNTAEKKQTENEKYMNEVGKIYCFLIREIMKEYEQDFKSNSIKEDKYTEEMKKLATEYISIEENIELTGPMRKRLLEVLKILIKRKEEQELENEQRIQRYLNHEIPLGDLYWEDLPKIKYTKTIDRIKRYINSSIQNEDDMDILNNMTIGQICTKTKGRER